MSFNLFPPVAESAKVGTYPMHGDDPPEGCYRIVEVLEYRLYQRPVPEFGKAEVTFQAYATAAEAIEDSLAIDGAERPCAFVRVEAESGERYRHLMDISWVCPRTQIAHLRQGGTS